MCKSLPSQSLPQAKKSEFWRSRCTTCRHTCTLAHGLCMGTPSPVLVAPRIPDASSPCSHGWLHENHHYPVTGRNDPLSKDRSLTHKHSRICNRENSQRAGLLKCRFCTGVELPWWLRQYRHAGSFLCCRSCCACELVICPWRGDHFFL